MIYKNALKVLFSNFNIIWKMVFYFLLVFVACGVGLYFLINPILKLLEDAGFFVQFADMYTDFISSLNLAQFFESFSLFLNNIFEFVKNNLSSIWGYLSGIFLIVFIFSALLFNLSNMASCVSLNYYMGSLTKQGFFASFSECFWRNLRFLLCFFIITLPLNFVYIGLFVFSLKMFGISWFLNLLAVFIIVIGLVLLFALKFSLLSVWSPVVVVMNFSIWKSFVISLKIVFKRFGRVFGNSIGIVLTIFALNMFFGLFTFMVGFLISIPISFLLYNSLGMVVVYEGQGMRYYVDVYNVVTPKKKEALDKLKDLRYMV